MRMQAEPAPTARFRKATALAIAALFLALATYLMSSITWNFDTVVFEAPAFFCFIGGAIAACVALTLSLRYAGEVARWLWQMESLLATTAILLLAGLLFRW